MRRSIVALLVTASVAFVVVAAGSVAMARRIAHDEILAEAVRNARTVSRVVFAPDLPAALRGEQGATAALDHAVWVRRQEGSLVRVKVWNADGMVLYSDQHALIGRTFPGSADVRAAVLDQRSSVDISELGDAENVTESGTFHRLVEVYVPLDLADGTRVAFELYASDIRLQRSQKWLTSQLVPFALTGLLLLLLVQLPVAAWLVRRVGRAQNERGRLLASSLTASERERRGIARDLHDGVVQDLAGASYAMSAAARILPPDTAPETLQMLEMSSLAVQRSVRDLRTLVVDIHPPDLTADGLAIALRELGARLHARSSVEVEVIVQAPAGLGSQAAALIYRCARECLVNIAKHAAAQRATVRLSGDATTIRLEISDDGRGLPSGGFDRRAEGHVGLTLLADAALDLGGRFTVNPGRTGGTTVLLELPVDHFTIA